MAKINGVSVELISKINGKETSTISQIMGIPTSSIPGWPGPSPSCVSQDFSYGIAPGMACGATSQSYDFDTTNQKLYQSGYCGNENFYATEGFYFDGVIIFRWFLDGRVWMWEPVGPCR